MEKIISTPGLQHLAEKVFWNLDVTYLKICAQINQSCKKLLKNPTFCIRKFQHLSKKNRKDWIKAIQSVKNSDKGIAIISYLQWNLKKNALVDLPCYTNTAVQDDFRERIMKIFGKTGKSSNEDIETVNTLSPLLTEITDDGNHRLRSAISPIYWAAIKGDTEIVKFLAPLADNPNFLKKDGKSPIYWAAMHGHTEIVKILAPLTENTNPPCREGYTPLYWAAKYGHKDIVEFLVPLTNNPNAPTENGDTPLSVAKTAEIREIFETSRNFFNINIYG